MCFINQHLFEKKLLLTEEERQMHIIDISNPSIFLNISNEVKADKAKFLVTFAALSLQRWRSIAELPPANLWPEYIDK